MAARTVIAICFAGIALAQSPVQPSGTGTIAGAVVDDLNGEPVRKAVVTLTLQGTPRTWATIRTDSSGRFEFQGLPKGSYDLRATKANIGTAIYGSRSMRELGELIPLTDGEARSGLKLSFIHTGSISGHVITPDGDPVQGVGVSLLRKGRNFGEPVLVNYRSATTDDRGEYRITGVDPGQYYALSNPLPGMGPMRAETDGLFAPQFYGGARESKDAAVVNMRNGDSLRGIDFRLIGEAPVRIQGRVTNVPAAAPQASQPGAAGSPKIFTGSGVTVKITPVSDGLPIGTVGMGTQPPDDRFEWPGVAPGKYRLEAVLRRDGKAYGATQIVDAQPNMGEIVLALSPAVDLKGQLKIEGQPPKTVGGINITLAPSGMNRRSFTAHVGPDGRFVLKDIVPGEYGLVLNQIAGSFLKSAQYGNKDVRFTRFEIAPGADAALNVVVSMHTAIVEGQVDPGEASRAGILIAPTGQYHTLARFYYGAPTDDHGKFSLKGLAPGKYKIFALEKMAAADFRNPEAADQLDALGEEIELSEDATVTVHPKLIPVEQARKALP